MKLKWLFSMLVCYSLNALSDEPKIPPIAMTGNSPDEQLFFCTTRIEAKSADGKRASVGTGFVVGEKVDDTQTYLFIVTCRHVVEGFDRATISFVAAKDGKPELGANCGVEIGELTKFVFFNSDPTIDVALIPLVPVLNHFTASGQTPFFRSIGRNLMPNEAAASDLSTIQPVLFIGYPSGIRDEKNLLPIARRGVTATPYVVDYNGLPLFLVDATVFPGSSGSPVLVFDQGSYGTRAGGTVIGSRVFLLGLISQAYFEEKEGEVQFKTIPSAVLPTYKQRTFLNLGVVVKARAIFATIDEFAKKFPPSK